MVRCVKGDGNFSNGWSSGRLLPDLIKGKVYTVALCLNPGGCISKDGTNGNVAVVLDPGEEGSIYWPHPWPVNHFVAAE